MPAWLCSSARTDADSELQPISQHAALAAMLHARAIC
jgi:hypothetical protein